MKRQEIPGIWHITIGPDVSNRSKDKISARFFDEKSFRPFMIINLKV
jgi:hypothetical protein